MNTTLQDTVKNIFKKTFHKDPLLVFSPGRLNVIGEHTDYNNGFVFPAAIDMGIVAGFQKSQNKHCTVLAIDANEEFHFDLESMNSLALHSWKSYVVGVVAEVYQLTDSLEPFQIAFSGNVPSGAGLSSSAALENSIVFGLNSLFNLGLSKHEMILISQRAEHKYAGVYCGIMDQFSSMFGEQNSALLLDCRSFESQPYAIDFDKYQFLLINTNVKHSLSDSAYNERRRVCEHVASQLQVSSLREVDEMLLTTIKDQITPDSFQKALYVIQESKRVLEAAKAIEENNLVHLGDLLYQSHEGLQNKYKVSCDELDFLVEKTKANIYVLGARMMGGGFGGCTINLITKSEITAFKTDVASSYYNAFKKQCSFYEVNLSRGTHLI